MSEWFNRDQMEAMAEAERAAGDPDITAGVAHAEAEFHEHQPTPTIGGCKRERHVWADEATAEGDTCECGQWYRFENRIESADYTPTGDPREGQQDKASADGAKSP